MSKADSILSGRAQDRLVQLQRLLANELRALSSHHSLLLGALRACDLSTQSSLLQEYLERVEVFLATATRLHAFVARHAPPRESVDNTNEVVPG